MRNKPLTVMTLMTEEGKGGSDRLALDISRGLRSLGHRIVWCAPSDCALNKEAGDCGLEMLKLPPWESARVMDPSSLIRFCRNEGIDIVNAHHSRGRHLLLRARLSGLGAKVVFTRHCILKTLPYLGSFLQNFIVDMNIAVSEVARRSLIRSGIWPGRAVTIYGGVDVSKFGECSEESVAAVRRRYAGKGVFTVGMVARLQHARRFDPSGPTLKGHEILFRALAGSPEDTSVLLLGPETAEDIEKLKAIARYNGLADERITFCGFQEDMAPFYKIMDLNVLPSAGEGLGLALIEGMAAGVPCIGADSGGIREIISDGVDGFLFKPGESADLAERIRILREDGEKRRLFASKGKKKAKEKFDIGNTVKETEGVFFQLL